MDHVVLQELDCEAAVLDHAVRGRHFTVVPAGAEEQRNQGGDDHQPDGKGNHDLDEADAVLAMPARDQATFDDCFHGDASVAI